MKAIHWRIKVTYNFEKKNVNQNGNLRQRPTSARPPDAYPPEARPTPDIRPPGNFYFKGRIFVKKTNKKKTKQNKKQKKTKDVRKVKHPMTFLQCVTTKPWREIIIHGEKYDFNR